ncbi:proton-coupled zinc antiporter SLC30A1-like isoform X2 [Ostrea edulis]|uniref:proton-coupled zinc antiporter SLC30A1-like isoform X2 n=1 Tax=Ostrea edulis TaxID=37623 RepID=UPI0024AF915B|nr:proton-coupled zinc antiporter SLC30A1-like isoform X2 [Ostrea edulis]XP_055996273.1 proton-coupled zinc antiporter SLC30A1-like isoform X2 [Ostrea edulis]XP_055996274.1 proton-coupled zinc antiporter SLC30A1-like isoform X2 [Ostrea edulis]XP_055996275.1 proton-coupled zinc antiporter SLC30A1-like isoform X2 [Ostrea edulis]XP_055996276.1 proton-coupled zinc antiporter SLC30A1-like isoform X2 [Ostrea edulis]XP_055996277.1 proton-coupled zinc antiporter SLC30A1-like isoform X2 [Ostrea edulis]
MARYSGKTCRLLTMLSMTASFFLVEIIVGYITNSIALVADSFHMLSDVVALIVGFASVRISKWQTEKNTFGWIRAEVLGALVNAVFLVALCFSIMVEALKRLVEFEEVNNPKLLLIVGGAGLAVNVVGLFLFHDHGHSHGGSGGHGHSHGGSSGHGHSHGDETEKMECSEESKNLVEMTSEETMTTEIVTKNGSVKLEIDNPKVASSSQLNMRGVFLHVLGDALGSVIVIISALIIWLCEGDWRFYVDPAMSIMMVIIILGTTLPLLKESGFILLQTVPSHINLDGIKGKLEKVKGVLAVHEFHVWQLAGSRIIASAHITCKDLHDYFTISETVKEIFHNEGIHSTTIQPEFLQNPLENGIERQMSERDCILECGPDKNCYTDTCCGQKRQDSKKSRNGDCPSREGSVKGIKRCKSEPRTAVLEEV